MSLIYIYLLGLIFSLFDKDFIVEMFLHNNIDNINNTDGSTDQ